METLSRAACSPGGLIARARRLALAAVLVVTAGCNYARLEPAETAQRVAPSSTTVVGEQAGVVVKADPRAWHGSESLVRTATPLALSITNETGRTLYTSRQDIALVGGDRTLPALPPETVKVKPLRTTVGTPPTDADWETEVMPTPQGDHGYSQDAALMREEIRESALPAGPVPVPDGESLSGFVYFDRLPRHVPRVDLEVAVRDRPGGQRVAVVRIPFRVHR
jgi:hypothetical protein